MLTESEAFREMYDKSDDILAAIEPRVVERPAARWTFATDPLVALRGARRSLRHGGDGRGSADGKLTCRWPHHAYEDVPGLVAGDRPGPHAWATARCRRRCSGWCARPRCTTRTTTTGSPWPPRRSATACCPPTLVFNRLRAESLMRFGVDGDVRRRDRRPRRGKDGARPPTKQAMADVA